MSESERDDEISGMSQQRGQGCTNHLTFREFCLDESMWVNQGCIIHSVQAGGIKC